VARLTNIDRTSLRRILTDMSAKGLVIDLWLNGEYQYMISPVYMGIFEFAMMRTGKNLNTREWAKLFHEYLHGTDAFWKANFSDGQKIAIVRTLPYEEAIRPSEYVEVLDYEKAISCIEQYDAFCIGICACRHEKVHADEKTCDTSLSTCCSFGVVVEYLIRNSLAKEVSKSEMLDHFAKSKEIGLVLNADNVKNNINFICHCCKCCCNPFIAIREHGYTNTVVTSSFIAEVDESTCTGCGKCSKACPVDAIEMLPAPNRGAKKRVSSVDTRMCLGCGVCGLKCKTNSIQLVKRKERLIQPETTFERIILQCLERGNLQNQIFDDPNSITQEVMRGIVGGFLRLSAVKKALMSDTLRSVFLETMKAGVKIQGKGWFTEI